MKFTNEEVRSNKLRRTITDRSCLTPVEAGDNLRKLSRGEVQHG